ncbi:MAG: dTMP kinase [Stackebrandtia sp.]
MSAGRFIVIEGPNAVGKTTIATLLADKLREAGERPVHATTEPTQTPLGRLLRSAEAVLTGRALALAIAADRCHHIDTEVIPHVNDDVDVVCDRYLPSSMVLQRVDGLDMAEIMGYNAYCLPPDLTVYLDHDAEVIAQRLNGRARLSRLESTGTPQQELTFYAYARDYLDREGWRQRLVDCRGRSPEAIVDEIIDLLGELEG